MRENCFWMLLLAMSAACDPTARVAEDLGLTECDGEFVDTRVDPGHCGGCDEVCPNGDVCSDGACDLTCASELTDCAGSCRDTNADRDHCGGCDQACVDGEVCDQGNCALSCSSDLTECDGSCRDVLTDPGNCGDCGTTCGAGEVCDSGSCKLTCSDELSECGGSCRDLETDFANCGSCGNNCSAGQACVDSQCVATCEAGLTECDGSCVDLEFDPLNCGACGSVCDGACFQSQCLEETLQFEASFTSGVQPSGACSDWLAFRDTLGTGQTSVTFTGSADVTGGITCSDATVVAQIVDALVNGTQLDVSCDGHQWTVCERYNGELWIDPPAVCSVNNCPDPGYIFRPCVGNSNWGGANTATCFDLPDQSMTLSFVYPVPN